MDPNKEIDLSDESLTPRYVVAREKGTLRRLLGSLALFAIGYGDVGSSIYYALGITTALRSKLLHKPAKIGRRRIPFRVKMSKTR